LSWRRDTREAALEAANVLKALNPYGKIVIRDLQTGVEIQSAEAVIQRDAPAITGRREGPLSGEADI
jgi:hypothetical protein